MKMVQVWTEKGPVEEQELARCTYLVGDTEYTYVLHPDPDSQGYSRLLRISELGSGFDAMVTPMHPSSRLPLREEDLRAGRKLRLKPAKVEQVMRSSLRHRLWNRRPEAYHEEVARATRVRLAWEVRHGQHG